LSSPDTPQFNPPQPNIQPQPATPVAAELFSPPPVNPTSPTGENPVWNGWDVLLVAIVTAVLTLLVMPLVVFSAAHHFVYPHEGWMEVARKPALALLSEFLGYIIAAVYMVLLVEGRHRARFWEAIRWNWPGIAGVRFLGLGGLMLGFDLLARFLPMPKSTPFDEFFQRPMDAYLVTAFAVTLGPLIEELFFRGFLYPVFARRMGTVWGVLFTGLLFGLIHSPQYGFSWGAVLIIFLVGVVLTAVRAKTKSVASSFLAHVGYNGTLMVLTALATDGFRHMDKAGVLLF
jgi:CAAX protease family protein